MRILLTIGPLLFLLTVQAQITEVGETKLRKFPIEKLRTLLEDTERYHAMPKTTNALNNSIARWPAGTWGQGYQSIVTRKEFRKKIIEKTNGYYWGCYPLIRYSGRILRGHLHAYELSPEIGNRSVIDSAVVYLLNSQLRNDDGSYSLPAARAAKNDTEPVMNEVAGSREFETAEALRALAEAHIFYSRNNIAFEKQDELVTAIHRSAEWLASLYDSWDPRSTVDRWKFNSNLPSLVGWSLAQAFRVEAREKYLTAVRNITRMLVERQQKDGVEQGLWLNGGEDSEKIRGERYVIRHDTKIHYHLIILRNLIESLDVLPPTDSLRADAANSIMLATNHVIQHRLDWRHTRRSFVKFFRDLDKKLVPSVRNQGGDHAFETLSLLVNRSQAWPELSDTDRRNLVNVLYSVAPNIPNRIHNFTDAEYFTAAAYYIQCISWMGTGRKIL